MIVTIHTLCFEGSARSAIIKVTPYVRENVLCFEGSARSAIIKEIKHKKCFCYVLREVLALL